MTGVFLILMPFGIVLVSFIFALALTGEEEGI